MKIRSHLRLALTLTLLSGTVNAEPRKDQAYWTSTAERFASGGMATLLTALLKRIENGDLEAWSSFANYYGQLDGEKAETYSVACAELFRRDPTFYLRRHLAGDARALLCAKRAYGWAGVRGRAMQDSVYSERLYIAATKDETERIAAFIKSVTAKN